MVEMTAPRARIQIPQVIEIGPTSNGSTLVVKIYLSISIVEETPMKSASKAEAKHAPQYLFLRQKNPPITRSAPEPIRHRITGRAGR